MRALIFVFTIYFSMNALAGPGHGGGGGGAKADFLKMARYLEREVRVFGKAYGLAMPSARLSEKLERLTLATVPGPLMIDGEKVDAKNYPEAVAVELDGAAWLENEPLTKYQVVVHEFLGLLEIPDRKEAKGTEYQLSQEIAQATFPLDGSFEIDDGGQKCDLLSARSSQLASALANCGLAPKAGTCARIRAQEDAVYGLYRAEGCRWQLRILIRP